MIDFGSKHLLCFAVTRRIVSSPQTMLHWLSFIQRDEMNSTVAIHRRRNQTARKCQVTEEGSKPTPPKIIKREI